MSYPSGNDIITLAEAKTLANIKSPNYDLVLTAQIPGVCRAVENYCKRHFLRNVWTQWVPWQDVLETNDWPINTVYLLGQAMDAVVIKDATNSFSFQVIQPNPQNLLAVPSLVVSSNQTFTTQVFSFATSTTLGALTMAVTAWNSSITFAYQNVAAPTVYANINTLCLRPGVGKTLVVGVDVMNVGSGSSIGSNYIISDDSDRILLSPAMLNGMRGNRAAWGNSGLGYTGSFANIDQVGGYWGPVGYSGDLLIIYDSGYDPANVPQDLKAICANILADTLTITNMPDRAMTQRAHSINFDATTFESAQIGKLIHERYASLLNPFCKMSV